MIRYVWSSRRQKRNSFNQTSFILFSWNCEFGPILRSFIFCFHSCTLLNHFSLDGHRLQLLDAVVMKWLKIHFEFYFLRFYNRFILFFTSLEENQTNAIEHLLVNRGKNDEEN